MTSIHMDTFQRPAPYWLRRAEKCKQAGDLRRAAVLERHAARTDPGYAAGPASYALTLRQLHCYEASNREAFAALAYDPSRMALYGLIGQNMIALGHRQEGLDAFSLYLNARDDGQTVRAPWDGDVYELEEAYWEPPVKRRARLNGLMHMILSRMARGDMDGASRALQRARRAPFQAPYARRDELAALWHERAGRPQEALRYVRRALRLRPYDAQLSASAACLLGRLGRAGEAASALTRAAVCASTPADELLVCLASEQLGAHEAAYAMLSRSLKRCSGRYPVLYDLAVCLLKLGRLEEASRSIHLCRELDPDDVPGEVLFNRVMDMETRALTPEQVRAEAASVSYYGSLNEEELNRCLKPVTQAVREGPGALAAAMAADAKLRARFLYMLALPTDWPAKLLPSVCAAMPPEDAQRLLRQVLLADPRGSLTKRVAMAMLVSMGAPAPYAVWQDGRLGYVDPTQPPPQTASFYQRMITRCLNRAAALAQDGSFMPWALARVRRMSESERFRLIADRRKVWPLALSIRYRCERGLPPQRIDTMRLNAQDAHALKSALHMLRGLKEDNTHEHH